MKSRPTDPDDDSHTDREAAAPTDGIYDDAALREAIEHLMDDEPIGQPLDDDGRRARIADLRDKIQRGEYMSAERLGEIVDRLLRKWKL